MNELDVLYRYSNAEVTAEGLGLKLRATRTDFVLRDQTRGEQEYARYTSLEAVEAALALRRAALAVD
jgi:hypothetical protein